MILFLSVYDYKFYDNHCFKVNYNVIQSNIASVIKHRINVISSTGAASPFISHHLPGFTLE